MGGEFSQDDWRAEMERQELIMFQNVPGLDMNLLTLKYVTIEMNGEPLRVRVQIYNDD